MPRDQIELFDPPATRRLIVKHGGWWGVDPSTRRIALCCVHKAPDADFYVRQASTRSIASAEGGERLHMLREAAREVAGEWAELTAPGIVVVEQPSGKQPNPALSYATGAIVCGLWEGLEAQLKLSVRIEMVASSKWKLGACGYGGYRKPDPKSDVPYGVLTWARELGYRGSSWDEADAWGIAEWARRNFALELR